MYTKRCAVLRLFNFGRTVGEYLLNQPSKSFHVVFRLSNSKIVVFWSASEGRWGRVVWRKLDAGDLIWIAVSMQEMGGAKYMVLSHKDDVADHARWAKELGLQRVIHKTEITQSQGTTSVSSILHILLHLPLAFCTDHQILSHKEGQVSILKH